MSPIFLIVASILDVKRAMQNSALACGSNGNRERFGLLFEEAFTEPNSGEVKGEIEVEQ
jgi:hypothetical protein